MDAEHLVLYTEGLNGLARQYSSLSLAFIVAVVDISNHDKIREIQHTVQAFLHLTRFTIPLPNPIIDTAPIPDTYSEGLRALTMLYSENYSLAFLTALKDLVAANPEAIQLRHTIKAYEQMVLTSPYAWGLLGIDKKLGSPTAAVAFALQDCIDQNSPERVDPTVQAANLLFGMRWFKPEQNIPVPAGRE